MRQIVQPGPAAEARIQWVEAAGRPVTFDLAPGDRLLDAVRAAFAAAGFSGGVLRLGGGALEPFATEMAITSGHIEPGAAGAPEATIDAALVDYTGGIAEGRLVRGDNPILMTLEIVLEPE
jgi:hypothetical protein